MVKTALIGCGGIAGAHVEGLAELHELGLTEAPQVVAVCDIDEARARERAAELAAFGPKPRVYVDLEELLAVEDEVEAVDICALHSEHHALAETAMAAGRHVIVEKPLGITVRAARRIIDTAVATRRILAVAENYRRSPGERAINWAIRCGRIGQPRLWLWQDVGEGLGKWGWRNFRFHAGGGWVLDGGVHFADLFRELEENHENLRYLPVVSQPEAEDGWTGETGYVHEAAGRLFGGKFSGHQAYLCGPPPMIDAAITALMQGRLFERDIFMEKFLTAADAEASARSPLFKRI